MTYFIIVITILVSIALWFIVSRVMSQQTADSWVLQHHYRKVWEGGVGFTLNKPTVPRNQNTTLLHVVKIDNPRYIVVFEVNETFPVLNEHAQRRVVETYLRNLDGFIIYDRFYTSRDLHLH